MVRKSEEFRLGTSSGPWVERRVDCLLDFGVATCGVYSVCLTDVRDIDFLMLPWTDTFASAGSPIITGGSLSLPH